jgi:glycosyltransferase involved in cell wall biosynthesis
LSEQFKLAAEFRATLSTLVREADVLHVSLKDPHSPPDIPGLSVYELPLSVNRASAFDIGLKSILFYLLIPSMVRRLQRFNPDVIYLSEALPLVGYLLRILARRKTAITFGDRHLHNRFGDRWWVRPLARLIESLEGFELRRVDGVFTRGETCRLEIQRHGVPRFRTRIAYDVPEPEAFSPRDASLLRRQCGFKEDDVILFWHGIMHKGKALDRLLQWTAELYRENPRFGIILVGTGPEETALRHLAERLGLGGRAHFTGWLETPREVGDYCNAADICIGMRRGDATNAFAISGALVHSMACRKVLLAPRLPGMSEIVQDGENGFLFTPDDGVDFKRIVRRVAANPVEAERVRTRAYEDIQRRFSVATAAREYADALKYYASLPPLNTAHRVQDILPGT